MAHRHPESTAKIAGHPIHPMLVPFPIAFLAATLFADVAYWASRGPLWAAAGPWLLGAAIVMALLAAVAGLTDFLGSDRVRAMSDAWQHMMGNVVAVVLAIVSFGIRLTYGPEAMVLPWGLLLSLTIVLILLFTGWKGGEMVYRHGVGVEDETEMAPAASAETPNQAGAPRDRRAA